MQATAQDPAQTQKGVTAASTATSGCARAYDVAIGTKHSLFQSNSIKLLELLFELHAAHFRGLSNPIFSSDDASTTELNSTINN